MKALGRVFKYGDNVDTDVIIPARYLNSFDGKELASHAMVDIDPEFAKKVQPGDLIVANKNFGCGSSREHAPLCLKEAGVSCVIAETFARILKGMYHERIKYHNDLVQELDKNNKPAPEEVIAPSLDVDLESKIKELENKKNDNN